MTVWGSSLQIGCRLILLISEHPIQQGIRKECWHRIPGNGTEFLAKWRSLRKKVSLTPKKWKFGSKKKSLSPNPSGHGLFAKNCIKIGLVWPQQLHFWSTGAYRGSPPYAIYPLPDTKKYSIVLCYILRWSYVLKWWLSGLWKTLWWWWWPVIMRSQTITVQLLLRKAEKVQSLRVTNVQNPL